MRIAKRGKDLRKIRLNRCYTVQECANLLAVSASTVRVWVRARLPVLEGGKPILIPGDGLKSWLKARWLARKRACLPDELFCCSCKGPRKPEPGSTEIIPRNAKTVAIRALCGSCGTKMNRAGSLANLEEIKAAFSLFTPHQVSLAGCETPAVIQHLEEEPKK